jgi:uncharacterized protein YndB with AHSA1/START domain
VITFETDVRIERSIEEVFDYVSDPLTFPRWNSAVRAVRETVAATYTMEHELPTGRAVNELEIVIRERPSQFAIRTTSGPTPFRYRYRFSGENGETVVQLNAEVELDGAVAFVRQLARRAVKKGVDDNLTVLKEILEARLFAAGSVGV